MIDVTKLHSSSLFAGFAQYSEVDTTINIPGNQTIPGFAGGGLGFFANIKRPSQQSICQLLLNVVGPSTVDGFAYDGTAWRATTSDDAWWYQPDGANFQIIGRILKTTPDDIQLVIAYQTLQIDPQVYVPAISVNVRAYFFKYPWE